MKRVYASPYIVDCDRLRVALSLAGIESVLKNEFGHSVGLVLLGGAAEFAAPEIWVEDDAYADALEIVQRNAPAGGAAAGSDVAAWQCSNCNESVEGTLGACWKCETARPCP